MFANNDEATGESVEVVQTTWPLPPMPEVVVVTNTTLEIHVPLGEIYEPIIHLFLIVSILIVNVPLHISLMFVVLFVSCL